MLTEKKLKNKHSIFFELKDEIENDSDSWDFEDFKIMTTRISDASPNLYVEEVNQLTELLEMKFAELQNK